MYDFMLDTYETERLKTLSVWSEFADADLDFRPAPLARTPREHMVHQCLSEHNWMLNMLGIDPGRPALPPEETRVHFLKHYAELSAIRLQQLRAKPDEWFNETATFFDESRPRCWILLRRLTHSAHHRAQLTVYLRLLGKPLYSTYGPTADTGGLPASGGHTVYRYEDVEQLLVSETTGRPIWPELPEPGKGPATERP